MQQQPQNPAQYQQVAQPVIIQTVPAPQSYQGACSRKREGFLGNTAIILGVLQILIGVLCIILNSIGIAIHCVAAAAGHGIWCGILFIVTGAFAVWSGKSKTICPIITLMVLSIISAVFCIPLLSISAVGLSAEEYNDYYYEYDFIVGYSEYSNEKLSGRKAVQSLFVVLALAEAIIAIVCASLCCHGICCCRTNTRGVVHGQTVQYASGGAGQQVLIIQGGAVAGGSQPVPLQPTGGYYPQQQQPMPAYGPQPGMPLQQPQYSHQQAPGPQAPPAYQSDPPPEYNPEFMKQKI